jgi:hypothetical protein
MTSRIIAALQIGSHPQGKTATLEAVLAFEEQIEASGAEIADIAKLVENAEKGPAKRGPYKEREGFNA